MIWAPLDQTYAVFCRTTGETHLLSELPAETLRALGETPRTPTELADLLAERCGVASSDDWRRKIAGIVESLNGLELVRQLT